MAESGVNNADCGDFVEDVHCDFDKNIGIVGNLREISFKTAELTDETVIVGISHLPFAAAVQRYVGVAA